MKAVVFGATGAVGSKLCELLSEQHPHDWTIDAVSSRSTEAITACGIRLNDLPNVKMVQGNAMDKATVLSLTESCDYIFCCIGFQQYQVQYWAQHWPVVIENLLEATVQGNRPRKLIFTDNLYAYGNPHPSAIHPRTTTPVPATLTSKPGIRATMRLRFQKHMQEYPGTLTVIGASDFFGPGLTERSMLGDFFTGKIVHAAAGGQSSSSASATILGSRTTVHDYCYAPDVARAMATVVKSPETFAKAADQFWIAPHSVHGKTAQEIAKDIAQIAAGRKTTPRPVNVSVLGPLLLYLLSPLVPFFWEMIEMMPAWTKDYRVDDSDFIQTFGLQPTPYQQALQEYVQFYQKKISMDKAEAEKKELRSGNSWCPILAH